MPKAPRILLQCVSCGHVYIPRRGTVTNCPDCKTPLEINRPKILFENRDSLEDYEIEEVDSEELKKIEREEEE